MWIIQYTCQGFWVLPFHFSLSTVFLFLFLFLKLYLQTLAPPPYTWYSKLKMNVTVLPNWYSIFHANIDLSTDIYQFSFVMIPHAYDKWRQDILQFNYKFHCLKLHQWTETALTYGNLIIRNTLTWFSTS